jgi:kynureninase
VRAATATPRLAHAVGALVWIDATHYAAHLPIDVGAIAADVLVCSPYKFLRPPPRARVRAGVGRVAVAARYKVRPAPDEPLGHRFETGTQPAPSARSSSRGAST